MDFRKTSLNLAAIGRKMIHSVGGGALRLGSDRDDVLRGQQRNLEYIQKVGIRLLKIMFFAVVLAFVLNYMLPSRYGWVVTICLFCFIGACNVVGAVLLLPAMLKDLRNTPRL